MTDCVHRYAITFAAVYCAGYPAFLALLFWHHRVNSAPPPPPPRVAAALRDAFLSSPLFGICIPPCASRDERCGATHTVARRGAVMEDQLLRAKSVGDTRVTNPHCYDIRKR